jgi:type IV pilus assembly protein PilA
MTQEVMMFTTLLQRLNERRAAEFEAEGSAESGFTLIELMVVLLILAILLAIAIPTFLGVTGSANDRSAQSNLNTALTNAKTIYEQQNQAYPPYLVANPTAEPLADQIKANEPSLPVNYATVSGGATTVTAGNVGAVTDAVNTNGAIMFGLANKTNECWWVADNTAVMTTASAPWQTTAPAVPATGWVLETTAGVPQTQGILYGVYKIVPGTTTCGTAGLAAVPSNVSNTSFPPAQ